MREQGKRHLKPDTPRGQGAIEVPKKIKDNYRIFQPDMTDAEIEAILERLPELTKWANDIMAYATDAAINHGKNWTGFKVVEGRSVRKYKDENAVAATALAHGFTDIYRQTLIPMTEMQKLMGKTRFEEILGSLVIKPQGKPTLVPITDKRPAMNVSDATNDFNEITED